MNQLSFPALLSALVFVVLGLFPAHAETDPAFENAARSLARLERLACQLASGITQQVNERGISSQDMREEIAVSTADSLQRATVCLKRRFFDGAEPTEIADRLLELDELAERVTCAGSRIGLYGHLREKLAAYLNERDWLKRQYGLN